MVKILISVVTCIILAHANTLYAEGDPAAGKQKAAVCAACHGQDGNSVVPAWPSIAGQHEEYIFQQMQDFKSGVRQNAQMSPIISSMTEEDFEDLAAFYADQEMTSKEAAPGNIEMGERLYRAGNAETGVAACMACHGPAGTGNPAALFPRLSGQHAEYTVATLRAYRAEERSNDQNAMMRDIASKMTDREIEAVANYIMGLH